MRLTLLYPFIVLTLVLQSEESDVTKEYPPYDGFFNNRNNPSWGAIDTPLTRRVSSAYHDGVSAPSGSNRPNPREISNNIMQGESGIPSVNNKTVLFVIFGKHIFNEIADVTRAGCSPEYFNIPVLPNDLYDPNSKGDVEIPYERSRYDAGNPGYSNRPRQQLNEATSFLDGSSIYGNQKSWSNGLRLFKKSCPDRTKSSNLFSSQNNPSDCRGELASENDEGQFPLRNTIGLPMQNLCDPRDHVTKSSKEYFRLGNRLGNENPFLLSFGIIWFRHHNWLARQIRDQHTDWSDEKVFNEARIRNVAAYQNIVLYEWLPILLGNCSSSSTKVCKDLQKYSGYRPGQSVSVTNIFQSAAMQYIDTLVPPGVFIRSSFNSDKTSCEFYNMTKATAGNNEGYQSIHQGKPALRLANTYWNPNEAVEEHGIGKLLMGMASQVAEKEDNIITSDIKDYYFGTKSFSRTDGVAVAIQRGRDHGLPDYNTARNEMGLKPVKSFEEINPTLFDKNPENGNKLLLKIKLIHNNGSLEDVDIYTGGMLETADGNLGELFRAVILEQFSNIRDGDRFWFENANNGLFTESERSEIYNDSIRDIILRTNPSMKSSHDVQDNPFLWNEQIDDKLYCAQPFQLKESDMESCVPLDIYDQFENDRISFIAVFVSLGCFIFVTIGVMYSIGRCRLYFRAKENEFKNASENADASVTRATEIIGEEHFRKVEIVMNRERILIVKCKNEQRRFEVNNSELSLSNNCSKNKMFIRPPASTYDLFLSFPSFKHRNKFVASLEDCTFQTTWMTEHELLRTVRRKEERDETLKTFFKMALEKAMRIDQEGECSADHLQEQEPLADVKLSRQELADYLKLKVNSTFLQQLFQVTRPYNEDHITFSEFLKISVLFKKGVETKKKIRVMFDMYDVNKTGKLCANDFKTMVKSMIESLNSKINLENLSDDIDEMMTSMGCFSKLGLSFEDFNAILQEYESRLCEATMRSSENAKKKKGAKVEQSQEDGQHQEASSVQVAAQRAVPETEINFKLASSKFRKFILAWERYVEYNSLEIFWVSFYTWITIGVFLYAFYAAASNKPSGLVTIAGYAVPIARGSAGALMFNFSTILLTMCRNIITLLRDTRLHRYIPFDKAVAMHKIVAWMGMFFSVIHIAAHGVNFYSISTQSAADILCIFRDYWFPSDFAPSFLFWCTQTITGVTGVILSVILIIMFVFASDYSRRVIYNWFHWTHFFGYIFVYFFCFLHGSGMLIQTPSFYLYFVGPATLYTFDKLYSLSRMTREITVRKAELLPSNVTHLEFERPHDFSYKAGQWVRIACLAQSSTEYHPFTLTSAPHENTLTLHIRAVGPWTQNLRRIYDAANSSESPYPKILLDGPFGEGHQDWYKYDVSVLVGGGIGVTPFASILKDLVNTQFKVGMNCKKVYFLWITRDQKQYEWLTDIIRDVEKEDCDNIFEGHIFITQFREQFDLRTTMLYICENKFKKFAGKSLFTGLKSETNFGRPKFKEFFQQLIANHLEVERFGVFSCGPPPMTNGVEKVCSHLNRRKGPMFCHHFENF